MPNQNILIVLGIALSVIACTTEHDPIQEESMIPLEEITIHQIHEDLKANKYSITELTQAYLDRIDAIDKNGPVLNAVIQLNPDALDIAKQLDEEFKNNTIRGPLHGIPVILKDNIDTHDKMPNTAGANAMKGSMPLQDSWVASKLREAGAVILGKSNLSEWANFHSSFSSSGWSALGGQTKNPYDLSRNPCGSSAGSGVAVSANLSTIAIGTETNGSIMCPSNNNGIVGIKPTVGLVSRAGIIPISKTQDTAGPMARTVTDAAICLGAITGKDNRDDATEHEHFLTDYSSFLKKDGLSGKKIGLWKGPLGQHFKVDEVFMKSVEEIKAQGAEIIEIEAISEENINGPSYQVLLYEFKDGLNQYFKSLGADAKVSSLEDLIEKTINDPIEMKNFDHQILQDAQAKGDLNSKEYVEALEKMLKHSREEGIDKVMDAHDLDAIIAPTGGIAWKTDPVNGDKFGVFSSSPAAIAGYPAITVPMGEIEGMPLGISFFGKAWSEGILIEMAYAYEQATKHRMVPKFID